MKFLILLLLIGFSAKAQISIGDEFTSEVVIIKTDTMTVQQSFELLDKLCKGRMWYYDRKVIYKGQTYFKFGWTFNRKRVYYLEGNKYRRIHI